jgi:hypothetical protein
MSHLHPIIPWELAVACIIVIVVVLAYELPGMSGKADPT